MPRDRDSDYIAPTVTQPAAATPYQSFRAGERGDTVPAPTPAPDTTADISNDIPEDVQPFTTPMTISGISSPTSEVDAQNAAVSYTNSLPLITAPEGATFGGPLGGAQGGDAFALLKGWLETIGLGDLAGVATTLLTKYGMSYETALSTLKFSTDKNPDTGEPWNAAYTRRFAGNQTRMKNGLNALDERTYLALENSYAETLHAYNLGNMLSTDAKKNQEQFAQWIGNDLAGPEFANRVQEAEQSVINMDPEVMATFRKYYGTITQNDLVRYFLAPDETLPMLQDKARAAQVGAAATKYGLTTGEAQAKAIAQAGYGYADATKGYAAIAGFLPETSKLSDIYGEQGQGFYGQKEAEAEQFGLTGAASAARKRKQFRMLEESSFQGRAGVDLEQVAPLGKGINRGFTF